MRMFFLVAWWREMKEEEFQKLWVQIHKANCRTSHEMFSTNKRLDNNNWEKDKKSAHEKDAFTQNISSGRIQVNVVLLTWSMLGRWMWRWHWRWAWNERKSRASIWAVCLSQVNHRSSRGPSNVAQVNTRSMCWNWCWWWTWKHTSFTFLSF